MNFRDKLKLSQRGLRSALDEITHIFEVHPLQILNSERDLFQDSTMSEETGS
jgi:hypothetical protein